MTAFVNHISDCQHCNSISHVYCKAGKRLNTLVNTAWTKTSFSKIVQSTGGLQQ